MPVSPAVDDLLASSSSVPASVPAAGVMMERECPSCDHRKISSSTKQLTAIGKCLVSFTCLRCKYIWDEVHESPAKSAAESAAESAAKSAAKSPLHNSTPRLVHTPAIETLEEKQRVLT